MAKVCLIYFDFNTGYYPSFHHGLAYIIGTLKNDKPIPVDFEEYVFTTLATFSIMESIRTGALST